VGSKLNWGRHKAKHGSLMSLLKSVPGLEVLPDAGGKDRVKLAGRKGHHTTGGSSRHGHSSHQQHESRWAGQSGAVGDSSVKDSAQGGERAHRAADGGRKLPGGVASTTIVIPTTLISRMMQEHFAFLQQMDGIDIQLQSSVEMTDVGSRDVTMVHLQGAANAIAFAQQMIRQHLLPGPPAVPAPAAQPIPASAPVPVASKTAAATPPADESEAVKKGKEEGWLRIELMSTRHNVSISFWPATTAAQLKQVLMTWDPVVKLFHPAADQNTMLPCMRLFHLGQELKNNKTMDDAGVKSRFSLVLMVNL